VADWIEDEVISGLQALLALRLRNTPAEDIIGLTLNIWVGAFRREVYSEGIDRQRIAEGFRRIFGRIREWPAPIDVIEQMPRRPISVVLAAPIDADAVAADYERVRPLIDELIGQFTMSGQKVNEPERRRELSKQAAQLRVIKGGHDAA